MRTRKTCSAEEIAAAIKAIKASALSMELADLAGLAHDVVKIFSSRVKDKTESPLKKRRKADR
jgi:HD superfamily phosphohydrolase YqeK